MPTVSHKPSCDRSSPRGWTVDTLAEYLIARISAVESSFIQISNEREERNKERFSSMKTSVDAALSASDKAIGKAEQATEKRFESVNEFRSTLSDQASTFLPRSEYSVQHKTLVDTSDLNNQRLARIEANMIGKSQGISSMGAVALGLFAGLSALAAISMLIFTIARH